MTYLEFLKGELKHYKQTDCHNMTRMIARLLKKEEKKLEKSCLPE